MKKLFRSVKAKTSGNPDRRSLSSFGSSSSVSQNNTTNGSFNGSFTVCSGYQVDLQAKDKTFSKLHKAAWTGDLVTLQKHLKKHDVNSVDKWRRSPMHLACCQGHIEVVKVLLLNKPDIEIKDNNGNTCLLKAVRCGHLDIVTLLTEKGGELNAVDNNGYTALHVAAESNSETIAKFLLRNDANLDAVNKDGCTALHLATENEYVDMTELLLRHGATVNAKDNFLRTCLMIACYKGNENLVTLFLDYNANILEEDEDGFTAQTYAINSGHESCLKLLKDQSLEALMLQSNSERESFKLEVNQPSPEPTKDSENEVSVKSDLNLNSWNDASEEEISDRKAANGDKGLLNPLKLDKFLLLSGSTSDLNSEEPQPPPKPPRSIAANLGLSKSADSLKETTIEDQETKSEIISPNLKSFSKEPQNDIDIKLDQTTEEKNITSPEKQKALTTNLSASDVSERSHSELFGNDDTDVEDVVEMISVPTKVNMEDADRTHVTDTSLHLNEHVNNKDHESEKSTESEVPVAASHLHKSTNKIESHSDNLSVVDNRSESKNSVKKLQDDDTDSNWDSSEELPLSHMSASKETKNKLVKELPNAMVNEKQHSNTSSKNIESDQEDIKELVITKPTDSGFVSSKMSSSNKEISDRTQKPKMLSLDKESQNISSHKTEDEIVVDLKKSQETVNENTDIEEIKSVASSPRNDEDVHSKSPVHSGKTVSHENYSEQLPMTTATHPYSSDNRRKIGSEEKQVNLSPGKESSEIILAVNNKKLNRISSEDKEGNDDPSYPQESIQLRYVNVRDDNSSYSDNSANGMAVVIKPVMSRSNSLQFYSDQALTKKEFKSDVLEENKSFLGDQPKDEKFDSDEDFDDSTLDLNKLIFNSDLQILRNDGTLGREDTLQGSEEIWEQNANVEYQIISDDKINSELSSQNSKLLMRQSALPTASCPPNKTIDIDNHSKISNHVEGNFDVFPASEAFKQESKDKKLPFHLAHPSRDIVSDVGYQSTELSNDNTPTEIPQTESESCDVKDIGNPAVNNVNSSGYTTDTNSSLGLLRNRDGFFSKSLDEPLNKDQYSLANMEDYHSLPCGNLNANIPSLNIKSTFRNMKADDNDKLVVNKVDYPDCTTKLDSSVQVPRKKGIFISKSLPDTSQNEQYLIDTIKSYHSLPSESLDPAIVELPRISKGKSPTKESTPFLIDKKNTFKTEPIMKSCSSVNIEQQSDARGDMVLPEVVTSSQPFYVDNNEKPISSSGDECLPKPDYIQSPLSNFNQKEGILLHCHQDVGENFGTKFGKLKRNLSEESDVIGLQEVMEHLNIRRRSSSNIYETIREKGKLIKSTCSSSMEAFPENISVDDDSVFMRRVSADELLEEECSPIHESKFSGLTDLEMGKYNILSVLKLNDSSSVSEIQDLASGILLQFQKEQNRRKILDRNLIQIKTEKAELNHINNILQEDQNNLKAKLSDVECQLESLRWEVEKKDAEKSAAVTELKLLKDQLLRKESALTEEALKCQRIQLLQGQLTTELNAMRKSISKENSIQEIGAVEKFPSAAEMTDLFQQLDEADQLCCQVMEENKILREQLETTKNQKRAEWLEKEENKFPSKSQEETKVLLEATLNNQKIQENAFSEIVLDYMTQINHLKAEKEELQKQVYGKHECGFCPHQNVSSLVKHNAEIKLQNQKQQHKCAASLSQPVEVELLSNETNIPLDESSRSMDDRWKFKFEEQERKFTELVRQLQDEIQLQNKEFKAQIGSTKSDHFEKVIEKLFDGLEKLFQKQDYHQDKGIKDVVAPSRIQVTDELSLSKPSIHDSQQKVQLDFWKEEISRKNSEISNYQNQLQNVQKTYIEEKEKLRKSEEKCNSLKINVDAKDQELTYIKQQLQHVKEELNNEIHRWKELLQDSNIEKSQIRDNYKIELNEKLHYIKDLEKEKRELLESIVEMKQEIQTVRNQNTSNLTDIKDSAKEFQQKITSLETTLKLKEQNLDQLNQMLNLEKVQLEETKKMLVISQTNEHQLMIEKRNMEALLHQTKLQLQAVMKDAETNLEEKNSVVIHVHEMENKLYSLEKEIETEKNNSKDLLECLQENQKIQKDLEEQIAVLKMENVRVVEHLQKEIQNQKFLWENEARSRAELTLQFLNQKKSMEDNPSIKELHQKVDGLESLLSQEKNRTVQFNEKEIFKTEHQKQENSVSDDTKKIQDLEKKLQEIQKKFKEERKRNQTTMESLTKLKHKLDETRQQLKLQSHLDKVVSLQDLLKLKHTDSSSHEDLKYYYEDLASREFNSKLHQIYGFLKEQSSTKEQLELVRLNNEVQLRSTLQHSKNELLEEITGLRTSLHESQIEVETLREQCKHLHELYNAEVKLNSRIAKDLTSSPRKKSQLSSPLKNNRVKRTKEKLHASKADNSPERLKKGDLHSTLRTTYDESAVYKLKAELNKSILQHLHAGSVNDSMYQFGPHTTSSGFKSN